MMNSSIPFYKIVLLGQGRVGKTSMTLKYVKNEFRDNEQSSINACYVEKELKLPNIRKMVKLAIWDTAGQQKYDAVAPVYYRGALGAIVVYQIISRESFEKVKKWVNELRQHADDKDIVIIIAGNKCDMETQRVISKEQVDNYIKQKNLKHFYVSAKFGDKINQLFQSLAEDIWNKKERNSGKNDNAWKGAKIKIQSRKSQFAQINKQPKSRC